MKVYQFSNTARECPTVTLDQLIDQMKNGSRYTFGNDNLLRDGVYRLMGWAFDCREDLHKYLIKQYGDWREVYAPNRTALRALVYGRIDQIVEL